MEQLPEQYREYLAGKDEGFIDTVLPVLQESAAEGNEGVRVVVNRFETQAVTDPKVPFGTVVEVND